MISNLNFADLSKSNLFGYAANLPFFSGKSSLDFEPGLTILFGPNGCGKSTVLNMLALSLAAKQGGFSAVTEDHVRSTVDMFGDLPHPRTGKRSGMQDKIGVPVAHDEQPVLFADPRQSVGLSAAGFDNDFLGAGLSQAMALRGCSHGQVTAGRTSALMAVLSAQAQAPQEITHRIKPDGVNEVWQKALKMVHARLQPTIPRGQMRVSRMSLRATSPCFGSKNFGRC